MVHYKIIKDERTEDAPFVGALISAIDCKFDCINCFNQDVKNKPTLEKSHQDIIKEVLKDPFNKGIILAGLEWSLQPDELRLLVIEALQNNLQVIVYTGLTEEIFSTKFPDLIKLPIYIKFGRYMEENKVDDYHSNNVKLATSNQYIKKF